MPSFYDIPAKHILVPTYHVKWLEGDATKVCPGCRLKLSFTAYNWRRLHNGKWAPYPYCRQCDIQRRAEYRHALQDDT